jgi:hypothetical protein
MYYIIIREKWRVLMDFILDMFCYGGVILFGLALIVIITEVFFKDKDD